MTSKRIIALAFLLVAASLALYGWEKAALNGPALPPAESAGAGEIAGRILFRGTPPALERSDMSEDPVCAAKHKGPVDMEDGKVNADSTLPNVFVYVKSGAENRRFPAPSNPVTLDQVGCVYSPHVLGIMVGQTLEIVSSDATTHNIHPLPKINPEWNQSQPPGGAPLTKRFLHPEVMIPVECNRHPWMWAYIGVTSNPFFAVTGGDGKFVIRNVPAGEYTLAAWTASFGTREQKVTVEANQTATVDFVFHAP
jgi:plastocyanin